MCECVDEAWKVERTEADPAVIPVQINGRVHELNMGLVSGCSITISTVEILLLYIA